MSAALSDSIDALLPQTQCEKCGFASCRAYADAIATGRAEINQCPPGGAAVIAKLAQLLQRPALPLNPLHGVARERSVVVIDEPRCIGCTLCIQACPVDAIVGGPKLMHTVLLEHCTGCELCIPPCPVDCIDLKTVAELNRDGGSLVDAEPEILADRARARYVRHQRRLHTGASGEQPPRRSDNEHMREVVQAALERARAKRKQLALMREDNDGEASG